MRQIIFLATTEEMIVEESRLSASLGEVPPKQLSHPDASTKKFCFWCKDVDEEQDEFWFYLPSDKLRKVRSVQTPKDSRSQIVFLATEERMFVAEKSIGHDCSDAPPDPIPHPDKPAEMFRFWRKDSNENQREFWFYLPASQFDRLNAVLQ